MKRILRKSYPSREAFKRAIQAFLDKRPGSDELEIANAVRSGLRETCEAIDELVSEGRIEPIKK